MISGEGLSLHDTLKELWLRLAIMTTHHRGIYSVKAKPVHYVALLLKTKYDNITEFINSKLRDQFNGSENVFFKKNSRCISSLGILCSVVLFLQGSTFVC